MKKYKELCVLLDEIKEEVRPNPNSLVIANNFIINLNKLIKKNNLKAEAVLGGSMAKNTFLKDDYDADVFVKFDYSYKGKNISSLLEGVLKNNFSYEKVKGSRDYFHVQEEFLFELVPVLNVSNIKDAENVIDMSPMHVEYFNKKSKDSVDEVRLLKKFMKANRVYGAESFINGFSGHVVDLLIIKYKDFLGVLKATSKWEPIIVIDIEKKLKDPLMSLDKEKISGPLVVVDPVQENRNAAAALGFDAFDNFIKASKEFLKNPSKDFFVFKTAKEIVNKEGSLLELSITPLPGNKDIAGAKILKIIKFLVNELKENDFDVKDYQWDFNETSKVYICLKNDVVEEIKVVRGPPINKENHCDAFKEKHEEIFEEKGFLYAKIKRRFVKAKDLLDDMITNAYAKERCKNISFKEL